MASIPKPRRHRLSKAQRRQRRQRQTRRTHAVRRRLHALHDQLPAAAQRFVDWLLQPFTRPTALRLTLLLDAGLLTIGNHTVLNLRRTLAPMLPGDSSSYRRVFSPRRWSSWRLARQRTTWGVQHLVSDGPIRLAGDDTVDEHRGKRVYGKGRPRDPVRSTHSYTAFRGGHQWVVLAILVPFPFTRRLGALPVLVALYRPEKENQRRKRRHKTPPELLRQLLLVLRRWFPDRRFLCAADGNFATHELADGAWRYRPRLTYLSHFYANANLYASPPPVVPGKKPSGRPRKKGKKLPSPAEVVQKTPPRQRQRLNVAWYGGGRRDVEVVTGTASWYEAGASLVPVLWVWVRDLTGTHREGKHQISG